MVGVWMERLVFAALVGLALVFPFEQVRFPISLGGWLTFTNVELWFVGVVGAWTGVQLWRRRWPPAPRDLLGLTGLWLGVLLLSALQAPSHRVDAMKFVSRMVGGGLLAWATYDLTRTWPRWTGVIRAMAISGMVVAVLGLLEATGWTPAVTWLAQFKHAPTRVGEVVRISATLIYATIASMVFELMAPLVLAWVRLALAHRRWWRVGVLSVGGMVLLTAQVLTLTRAGWIALGITFLVLALLAWARDRGMAYLALGSIGLLGAIILITAWRNPVIALRLVSETDRAWYRAVYTVPPELRMAPGEEITVSVVVRNTGLRTWVPEGAYAFALGYHVYREDGTPVSYDGVRTSLPQPVAPGEEIRLDARVVAPTEPGTYRLEWDMVQEAVTWFSWKGTPVAVTRLYVVGPPVATGKVTLPPSQPPTDVRLLVPAPGRLTLWRTALRMVADRPLLGVGPDNFRLVYGTYAGVELWDKGIHANSLYLEWAADTGILGLLAFLAFAFGVARRVWQYVHPRSAHRWEEWVWRLGLAGALLTWFVHGIFDYFYEFLPTSIPFWIMVGLAVQEPLKEYRDHARGV